MVQPGKKLPLYNKRCILYLLPTSGIMLMCVIILFIVYDVLVGDYASVSLLLISLIIAFSAAYRSIRLITGGC